jgi:hypothetical protein
MRPQITIKTSTPLQRFIIQKSHDEEDMEILREQRDNLLDHFAERAAILDQMEDRSGLEFAQLSIDVWYYRGQDTSISSPLLISARDNPDVEFLELIFLLAKELMYQNLDRLQPHEMLETGIEKMDVTAGLLAYRSLASMEGEDYVDDVLEHDIFQGESKTTWDTVKERSQEWSEGETLLDFLGIEQQERQDEPV